MTGPINIFTPQPWIKQAACAGTDTSVFFTVSGASTEPAKAICADCPVRTECLEYALQNDSLVGVWGGLSRRQRVSINRQRRKADAAFGKLKRGPRPGEKPIKHGTYNGYRMHMARGIDPCDYCMEAMREHGRQVGAQRRARAKGETA
jgi:hypothetical protein